MVPPVRTNPGRRAVLRGHAAVIVLLLLLLTGATFLPLAGNGFVNYDDGAYITTNPFVNDGLTLRGVHWAFTTFHTGNWHPLTWLSHMFDVDLFGLRPAGHHLPSLLIHLVNTLLLFFLFRSLTGAFWRSACVAALFSVHPLHVDSVAWAAERKDVLSALFALLALLAWLKNLRRPGILGYAPATALFALALLAKPMPVTLPFVMLLLDWWPLGRWPSTKGALLPPFPLWREKAPLFALAAASGVVTYIAQSGAMTTGILLPLSLRLANALVSYLLYLGKTFWPRDLAVLYPYSFAALSWPRWVGALMVLAIVSCLVVLFRRRRPYLAVGWFWYLGMLIPVIGLIQVGSQAMADRYTYLPLTGVFLFSVWGLADLTEKRAVLRIPLTAAAATCLIMLAAATFRQVKVWHDDFSLYGQTLRVTERNWAIHYNLGCALAQAGKPEAAIEQFRETLKIAPDYLMAQNNLALELKKVGNVGEAIAMFLRILKDNPRYDTAHSNLGRALFEQGRREEAEFHYRRAVEINPRNAVALTNLGSLYYAQWKDEEAAALYRRAVEIDPRLITAHFNLGLVLKRMGRLAEALPHLGEAVRLNPENAAQYVVLGHVLAGTGRTREAAAAYERALAIDPLRADARLGLELLRR